MTEVVKTDFSMKSVPRRRSWLTMQNWPKNPGIASLSNPSAPPGCPGWRPPTTGKSDSHPTGSRWRPAQRRAFLRTSGVTRSNGASGGRSSLPATTSCPDDSAPLLRSSVTARRLAPRSRWDTRGNQSTCSLSGCRTACSPPTRSAAWTETTSEGTSRTP